MGFKLVICPPNYQEDWPAKLKEAVPDIDIHLCPSVGEAMEVIGDADAAALRAGAPDAEYVEIDAMNHVFKEVPADDPFANRASYADASLPVAPALVEAVAEFVMRPRGEEN